MADMKAYVREGARPPLWLGTFAIVSIYGAVMASTNTRFRLLDDECDSIAIAGRPLAAALRPFLTGLGFHELHPPVAEILMHLWLTTTHYSFFLLRVFANIFFVAAAFLTARSDERAVGRPAHWTTLLLSFFWLFAFQFGRIMGWYCVSMFFLDPSFFLLS